MQLHGDYNGFLRRLLKAYYMASIQHQPGIQASPGSGPRVSRDFVGILPRFIGVLSGIVAGRGKQASEDGWAMIPNDPGNPSLSSLP